MLELVVKSSLEKEKEGDGEVSGFVRITSVSYLAPVQPSYHFTSKYFSMSLSKPIISPQSKYSYQPHFILEEFECKNFRFQEMKSLAQNHTDGK